MAIVKTAFSSTIYLAQWKATEQEIIDTGLKIAGLSSTENSEDVLRLTNRLEELKKLSTFYKGLYDQAYLEEQGSSRYGRMATFNNGL